MSVSEDFKALLAAIAIDNGDTIALRYGEITCALNQQFRDTDSKTANSLQVGSYGRWTAIKGVSDQNLPDQDYFAALGSGQRVKVKKRFQKKAKKAFELAEAAIAAAGQAGERAKWRKIFGRGFPAPATLVAKVFVEDAGRYAKNTEQFIEDMFAVDIRYPIRIDCEVTEKGSIATKQSGWSAKNASIWSRLSFLRKTTPPAASAPCA